MPRFTDRNPPVRSVRLNTGRQSALTANPENPTRIKSGSLFRQTAEFLSVPELRSLSMAFIVLGKTLDPYPEAKAAVRTARGYRRSQE
jgi:hypothetical protein